MNLLRLERLPTVAAVETLPGQGARLTLEGKRAPLNAHAMPAACLLPLPHGGAVLVEDHTAPDSPAYRVPAQLCAAVSAALSLRRVES